MNCTLILKDFVNASFEGLSPACRRACYDKLKFFIHSARHTPAYKLGRWDGCVSYFAINGNTYINLLDKVLPTIMEYGYEVDIEDHRPEFPEFVFPEITEDYLTDHMGNPTWPKGHPAEGESIKLREHQVKAIKSFAENPQGIGELCTSFGKTLVTAVLSHMVEEYGRSLIIVPNRDLVKQTEEDYRLAGLDVGVYFGGRKELGHKHTIATWQSLGALIKKKEEGIDTLESIKQDLAAIISDETHQAKANVLKDLLCKTFANIPIRWGLTGTVPKDDTDFYALLSGIGPLIHQTGAKELMEKGILSNCHIHMLQLQDTVEFGNFPEERHYLATDNNHLEWLSELLKKLSKNGNTLVLVDRIETGKILEQMIPDMPFVYGGTGSNDRKESYDSFKDQDNLILGASYGVAAVGINLPRIFNLVLLEPGKSPIKVIQSIGRGIRKAKDKDFVNIYDISSSCKFSKRHMKSRKKLYDSVEYPHKTTKVDYLNQLDTGVDLPIIKKKDKR